MIHFIILSYLIVIDKNDYHIKYVLYIYKYIYITTDLRFTFKKVRYMEWSAKNLIVCSQ